MSLMAKWTENFERLFNIKTQKYSNNLQYCPIKAQESKKKLNPAFMTPWYCYGTKHINHNKPFVANIAKVFFDWINEVPWAKIIFERLLRNEEIAFWTLAKFIGNGSFFIATHNLLEMCFLISVMWSGYNSQFPVSSVEFPNSIFCVLQLYIKIIQFNLVYNNGSALTRFFGLMTKKFAWFPMFCWHFRINYWFIINFII